MMKRIQSHLVGVDQGSQVLFSDFEDDGEMWSGTGPRVSRHRVKFSEEFQDRPTVHLTMSMWDLDQRTNPRADISSDAVTSKGFDIVFRTWGDTRVARVRADWIAIGPVRSEDEWDV